MFKKNEVCSYFNRTHREPFSVCKFVSNPAVYFSFGVKLTSYLKDYSELLQALLATASLTAQTSDQVHQHVPATPLPEQMLSAIVGLKKNKAKQTKKKPPPCTHAEKEQWSVFFVSNI